MCRIFFLIRLCVVFIVCGRLFLSCNFTHSMLYVCTVYRLNEMHIYVAQIKSKFIIHGWLMHIQYNIHMHVFHSIIRCKVACFAYICTRTRWRSLHLSLKLLLLTKCQFVAQFAISSCLRTSHANASEFFLRELLWTHSMKTWHRILINKYDDYSHFSLSIQCFYFLFFYFVYFTVPLFKVLFIIVWLKISYIDISY